MGSVEEEMVTLSPFFVQFPTGSISVFWGKSVPFPALSALWWLAGRQAKLFLGVIAHVVYSSLPAWVWALENPRETSS